MELKVLLTIFCVLMFSVINSRNVRGEVMEPPINLNLRTGFRNSLEFMNEVDLDKLFIIKFLEDFRIAQLRRLKVIPYRFPMFPIPHLYAPINVPINVRLSKPGSQVQVENIVPKPSNQSINENNVPKPDNLGKDEINVPKPVIQVKDEINVPKPVIQVKDENNIPKPDNQGNDGNNVPKPVIQVKDENNFPKPDNQGKDENNVSKPAILVKEEKNIPKPDNQEKDENNAPKPDNQDKDKKETSMLHGFDSYHDHVHYMQRFPGNLSYLVSDITEAEYLKLKEQKNTSSEPEQISSNTNNEENTKVENDDIEENTAVTLEPGPDVMNDAVRNGYARILRSIQSPAVPADLKHETPKINSTDNYKNISKYLNHIFTGLNQSSVNELLTTLKDKLLSSATPAGKKIIEETFKKISTSLSLKSERSKDDIFPKSKSIEKKLKTELLAKAAAALDLLTEESSSSTAEDSYDDTTEYFLDDESYPENLNNVSLAKNNDETVEPSFHELISLADRHKASRTLKDN